MSARFLQQRQCVNASAEVLTAHTFMVRYDDAGTGFASDLECLPKAVFYAIGLIPHMSSIDPMVIAQWLSNFDHLFSGCSSRWRIEQPGRQTERARFQALRQEASHPGNLG